MNHHSARRERESRAGLLVALTLSVAAHALALGVRFDVQLPSAGRGTPPDARVGPNGSVIRALDLVITPEAVPSSPARMDVRAPAQLEETDHPSADLTPSAAAVPSLAPALGPPAGPDPRAGLRERLAPRLTDRRLWFDPVHSPVVDSEEPVRIRAPVREGVAALNDSIAADAERERRISDWTTRDEEGSRWGISPDRVHLGGLVLKLRHCTVEPCEGWLFPTPADRRDEYENRQRGFAEIRFQAARAELDEALADRAAAVRSRMAARRDSSRGG